MGERIVFFGSGIFAVASLKALLAAGRDVCLVVTQPDTRQGRHLFVKGTPVKEFALSQNLKVFQPDNINAQESRTMLSRQEADIFMVVAYGHILSRAVLALAKHLCINIHASLLPLYRGASPINQALINGDQQTGVTFIRMNERMDEGDIIFQKKIDIAETDNAILLEEKLSVLAAGCLEDILLKIENGNIEFRQQSPPFTYAPLLKKQDGLIRWDHSARVIYNHFRGCFGWPGAFTYYKGRRLKVLSMAVAKEGAMFGSPGKIINMASDFIEVACGDGSIVIKDVLPESHNKMAVKSFQAGHKIKIGDVFGKK